MLYWAAIFFILAIVAALFGFSGVASAATQIAVVLFWVFVALLVVSLIVGWTGGGRHPSGTLPSP